MFDKAEALRKLALNLARFSGLAPLAGPLVGGIGAVLMLHRVTANPRWPAGGNRHLSITPDFLDQIITAMKADGYRFVSLDEAIARIGKGRGGEQFATITADDGYRDNLAEALPVLDQHKAPVTIYVAPGLMDGSAFLWWEVIETIVETNDRVAVPADVVLDCSTRAKKVVAFDWLAAHFRDAVAENDRDAAVSALAAAHACDPLEPNRTLMSWHEISRISAHPLVTIGAHTIHHRALRRLSADEALFEISSAAEIIERELGQRPQHMAYPYGYESAVGPREAKLAKRAGFLSAVTTRHGVLQPGHAQHLHALPRIAINGRYQRVAYVRTMLTGFTTVLANSGRTLVTV